MATVSLKDLSGHLSDAAKLCDAAMKSDADEPDLDFAAVRKSLRSALELLGEESNGAADSVSGFGGKGGARGLTFSIADVFPPTHPHRNAT